LKRILIIGGSEAGISAALRAREVYPIVGITMVTADKYPTSTICRLPVLLGGEAVEWGAIAHRSGEEIEKMGIRLLLEHRARNIDVEAKTVEFSDRSGRTRRLPYDRLILATGTSPGGPAVAETDLPGVFFLRGTEDSVAMGRYVAKRHPRSAVVVGSDGMGMEVADALSRRGLSVTMLARSGKVLNTVDPRLQDMVRVELGRNGVKLIDRIDVTGLEEQEGRLSVRNTQEVPIRTDLVVLADGSSPRTDLAKAAGIPTGTQGAIRVNRAMETSLPEIYAAGDGAETWHRLLKRNVYLPFGTTAQQQGRVAGENAAGGRAEFVGTLGTQAVRIFDLVIARTGLRESEAREAGFDPITSEVEVRDDRGGLPGATPMRIRVTGDRRSRQLLGAQIAGHRNTGISKRIDVFATAISAEMSVDEMLDLDLSYSPWWSGTWDPLQTAALEWIRGCLANRVTLPRPGPNFLREDKEAVTPSGRLSFAV
jgi:NADPH-dependent 2,4-dienoyl-CoA reductase/sulfur reductase-like enzyme